MFYFDNFLVLLYYKCNKLVEVRVIFDKMLVKDLVFWNVLLLGYVSFGYIGEVKLFFKEMEEKNILMWMIMILGLVDNGFGEEGLRLFFCMRKEGFELCDYVFFGVIKLCVVFGVYCNG